MNKTLKIIIFGLVVWLLPSIVTLLISHRNEFYLFDVISALSIALTVIMFSYLYFKSINTHFIREGVIIGLVWLFISLILDVLLIFLGITKLSLIQYAIYIAPLYIIVPAITIGFGLYNDQMGNEQSSPQDRVN